MVAHHMYTSWSVFIYRRAHALVPIMMSYPHLLFSACVQGLNRIKSRLSDEALDAPGAPAAFKALLEQAGKEGWLPAELEGSKA
jgi:hypothetical protein